MALILKALAGISALVLLAITLFSSLIAIGGALLATIKFADRGDLCRGHCDDSFLDVARPGPPAT